MANTLLTPQMIAREALMVLRKNAVMANLVYRDYADDFNGKVGDTITVRKPTTFVANEFETDISVQNAVESGIPVKLDKLLDVSFAVTAKELSLNIQDFSAQFLVPAMQAFADKIDKYLIDIAHGVGITQSETNPGTLAVENIIKARKFLVDAGAPTTERRFVYGSQIEADLLKTDLFISAGQVGDDGTALREASLGRKFGLDFYCDQNETDTSGLVFHKNGLALVTRTLDRPFGTDKCDIVNYDGFGLRVVYDYDINKKTDTISIDMLCGTAILNKDLVAKIAVA